MAVSCSNKYGYTGPMMWQVASTTGITSSTTGCLACGTSPSTAATYTKYPAATYNLSDIAWVRSLKTKIAAEKQEIELPDGAKLLVDEKGNYRIEDKDAKVTYRANKMREFSPHLNASDMVAKFVEYVGGLGVRRDELLKLPLQLFINWLVIEAAERDDDPLPPDIVQVAAHPDLKAIISPKCLCCGRFIKRLHVAHRFPFCTPEHGAVYVQRKQLPARIDHVEALPALAQ